MKNVNLLGIRKKVILCRTKAIGEDTYSVMRPLTEQQEKELDKFERTEIDNKEITRKSIYIYGEVNLDSKDDIDAIKKLNLSNPEGNNIHSNFNYEEGVVYYEERTKFHITFDALEWFKYNYCMLGKPSRIVIYECVKSSL